MMKKYIFGIRHHGPGCARQLLKKLAEVQPDLILIEGPSDANEMIPLVAETQMKPPVALLGYETGDPKEATFYPFTEFSPEWQSLKYGLKNNIPIKFIDLPFALRRRMTGSSKEEKKIHKHSPFHIWAQAAGYEYEDQWWEHHFEQRIQPDDYFEAIHLLMHTLREDENIDEIDLIREAWMRKNIREAEKEGYEKIAIICGAWHVPALEKMPTKSADNKLLRGLKKVKTSFTWIPWTYSRMTYWSGYGAGILSPGWYEHLWKYPDDPLNRWITKVGRLLRKKEMDISTAHVIESVRLANSLAAIRDLPVVGLQEMNDAVLSVMCGGVTIKQQLIDEELIIGDKIGKVPNDAPAIPIQKDLQQLQKRLRLKTIATSKEMTLDLRKELDLERSKLFHRLLILEIPWGIKGYTNSKGTFKENWTLTWKPELIVLLIEKGIWGNTISEAATAYVIHRASESTHLPAVTELLENCIPADLPKGAETLILRIQELSAVSGDILQLMQAMNPILQLSRYGDVRNTNQDMLLNMLEGMLERVCIGLPSACVSLDYDSSVQISELLDKTHNGILRLSEEHFLQSWERALAQLSSLGNTNSLVSGKATRLLNEWQKISEEVLAQSFSQALSIGNEVQEAAYWLEGFLKGGGTILLFDDRLWEMLNDWIQDLPADTFLSLLPILRRNFSTFSTIERRKLGEKASNHGKVTKSSLTPSAQPTTIDTERAEKVLPIIQKLLGIQS